MAGFRPSSESSAARLATLTGAALLGAALLGVALLGVALVGCDPSPVAEDDGGDSSASAGGDADVGDGAPPDCQGLDNVEVVADREAATITLEASDEGFAPVTLRYGQEVDVAYADYYAILEAGAPPPEYYASEAELLALPADDRLRTAYEAGDLVPPDWTVDGLLVLWQRSPYTDWLTFSNDDRLRVYRLRLAACLRDDEHTVPPAERAERWAYRVPLVTTVEPRFVEASFRLVFFASDPAWSRHPDSPFINRAGGNQTVAWDGSGYQIWVNGYSGATGFIFRGTSADGIAWDFSWDTADTCTFDGVILDDTWRRDPTVLVEGGELSLWYTRLDLTTGQERLRRSVSSDGLTWTDERIVQVSGGPPLRGRAAPFVLLEGGTYHLWAHASDGSILHATASDGLAFTADATPALEPSDDADALDGFGVYLPAVRVVDGEWLMLYTAHYGAREVYQRHIAAAASSDGVSWTKLAQPLLSQDLDPGGWEADDFGRPWLLEVGGALHLYYTAGEGGEPSVGLATATAWSP